MGYAEADTRAKLIDPAIRLRGWTEEHLTREETAGANYIDAKGKARKSKKRIDYVMRLKLSPDTQPVAVAFLEAKAEDYPPERGFEQVKDYQRASKRHNVPFVYATNGHLFIEYDQATGQTSAPRPLTEFPTTDELRARYEAIKGFDLSDDAARPLLVAYPGGDSGRRYYQDAAVRAVLEKLARVEALIAQGEAQPTDRRALLSLATGSGKTYIAVSLLYRIAMAGNMGRALFICDRDELRTQALAAFQRVFGADAQEVSSRNAQKNARVLIATYQTLDVDSDEAEANFLMANYPPNFFSHIIIDECHRSGWGKWRMVFERNPAAAQIGLTATPRTLKLDHLDDDARADLQITADNVDYFGEPVYEYELAQGIDDGYLAVPQIIAGRVDLDDTGVTRADLLTSKIVDATTGLPITDPAQLDELYERTSFEDRLLLPDRVRAMAIDLFNRLLAEGDPEQKTVIFCVRDSHAQAVANELNNLYARWCKANNRQRLDPYAFKCTAESGSEFLAELKESTRSYFIATTVNLLEAGVDVPWLRNVVFFRYVRSPISFYQMLGRGTRVVPYEDYTGAPKLSLRVYDYTDATRLLGEEFQTKPKRERTDGDPDDFDDHDDDAKDRPTVFRAQGLQVRVSDAGRYVVTSIDGRDTRLTEEEYRAYIAEKLRERVPTLDDFRIRWIDPTRRAELLSALPNGANAARALQQLLRMSDYDLYDVLAEVGYAMNALKRGERADAFQYKHESWLATLPPSAAATVRAIAAQFARDGTDGLENINIFNTASVRNAGGLDALKQVGKAKDVLTEMKARIFAA